MRTSWFLATLLIVSACAPLTVGSPFDPAPFMAHAKRGETTTSQVLAWLGPPNAKGEIVDADGRHFIRWLYFFGQGKLPKLDDMRFRILEIHFDPDGKLAAYNWSGEGQ